MASVVLTSLSQPSVEPFLLRQLYGHCQEYPQPSVPILRESSQQQPRGSSGGTASCSLSRIFHQVYSLVTALCSSSLSQRPWRRAPVSGTSGTRAHPVPSIILCPFTPVHVRASGPHHQVHLSNRLTIHASTQFPPPAQLAHWQQS